MKRLLALVLAAVTFAGALAVTAGHAAAGEVAPDYQTATRPIVFPVAGPNSYSDTFGACRSGCSRGHEGTDIMNAKLTPLVAATDATVTWLKDTATPDGKNGNYLMLRDADGWQYFYVHINNDTPGTDDGANPKEWIFAPGIQRGSKVKAGQLIAYNGDSGNAEGTGAHLHFEIHKPDGTIINPYRSLRTATKLSGPVAANAPGRLAAEAFVDALYRDFLSRSPSPVERAEKTTMLLAGVGRSTLVNQFATSDEWIQRLVDSYYRSTLGRDPDASGRAHWIAALRKGMTPADVAASFYASDEYFAREGGTNAAWVHDLYRELLDRDADAVGHAHWVGALERGVSRRHVAHDFYQSLESRRGRVTGLYEDLLGRAPDSGGLTYWAGVLSNGRDLSLATNLASSPEYHQRAQNRFA